MFVELLPYLEQPALYHSINFDVGIKDLYFFPQPFGLAENVSAMNVTVAVFLCPSDGGRGLAGTGPINYRGNMGADRWAIVSANQGAAGPLEVPLAATTDGLSTTVVASEKLRGSTDGGYLDPGTAMIFGGLGYPYSADDSLRACMSLAGAPDGFSPAGGLTWFVGGLSQTLYNQVLTPNNLIPDCVSPDSPVMGIVSSRSHHPGGVHAAMLDGSLRFVRNTVDRAVWRAIATRAGGEIVSADAY